MSTFERRAVSELEGELQEQELLFAGMPEAPALELYAPTAPPRGSSTRKEPYVPPAKCRKILESKHVVVVGGGFAGLMAAMRLRQNGVRVTLFEARPHVGGRVLSNTKFSPGRITEEGAELIGSFHTTWLGLARVFGLSVISRMEPELYDRAGLDVKFRLFDTELKRERDLSKTEVRNLSMDMDKVLKVIADMARKINEASEPWQQRALEQYDNVTVETILKGIIKTLRRLKKISSSDGLLWEWIKVKLVNDEVEPLETMNFLGLLCKVKAGQGPRFRGLAPVKDGIGYWTELEIFRCADGCQTLANKMAESIQTVYQATLLREHAVTDITLSNQSVQVEYKAVNNGTVVYGPAQSTSCHYVILAIPPSVWDGVSITVEDKNLKKKIDLKKEIGKIGMSPAVKFFSKMRERFWVKQTAAPYGGGSKLGQVWEGTDNQTRVGSQGVVLSVFAGPILDGAKAPTPGDCIARLHELFPNKPAVGGGYLPGYFESLLTTQPPYHLFSNWPDTPFIKTGYVSPRKGEIFGIARKFIRKFSKPVHARLFFAGEHTDMGFFGYMEGALRSGQRAAEEVMREACGQPEQAVPASPSLIARAASTRETAF